MSLKGKDGKASRAFDGVRPSIVAYFIYVPPQPDEPEGCVFTGVKYSIDESDPELGASPDTDFPDDDGGEPELTPVGILCTSNQSIPVFTTRQSAYAAATLILDAEVRMIQKSEQPLRKPGVSRDMEAQLAIRGLSIYTVPASALPIEDGRIKPEPIILDMDVSVGQTSASVVFTRKPEKK